ncbi:serine/threonine-protein kinase [Streptomyces antarcticus]|uniref:serine/threonine-protein kinase n=1 Tax=Streptomyces antarcticus TaxID=2996458 RepID=UPI0022711D9D|nr:MULTISPECIES: serine/threonine-protein kinase [unclassified Streptomyces]MCY0946891.1 protein kinase [Streptomyces sp. H34-AA3]MCZ4085609.1 protein kinase [Streptomyces sp. H34-S5]
MESLRAGDPTLVGPYRIAARLGSGGMGSVYLGRSRGGRSVAVKVIRPELAEDPEFRRRFAREVRAARLVNGVYTAGVIDADPTGSPPWLATAYVAGPSLSEAVRNHGPWPGESVLALAAGVAEALEAIHVHGVVHRDLKPSNVLLASDGPRVIDFGISAVADAATELTRVGTVIGTPGFMAPEQLTGAGVTAATDVFSLGAVLAFTASGTGPFGAGTTSELMYRVVHDAPDLGALPAGLRDLVARCLAKDPARRPTVSALLDQLADGPDTAAGSQWLPPGLAGLLFAPAGPGPSAEPATPADPPAPPDPRTPAGPGASADPRTPAGPRVPADPRTPVARSDSAPPGAPVPPVSPTAVDPEGPTWTAPPPGRATVGAPPPVPPHPPVVTDAPRAYGPVVTAGGSSPRRTLTAAAAAVAAIGLLVWLVPRMTGGTGTSASPPTPSPAYSTPAAGQGAAGSTADSGTPTPGARTGPARPSASRTATPRTATPGSSAPGSSGPRTSSARAVPVVGSWQGTYLCGQGLTRLDLRITSPGGKVLEAVFAFSAHSDNPTVPNGSFTMVGSFEDGRMTLRADRWINRPPGYLTVDLTAVVAGDRPSALSGAVISTVAACTQFVVGRQP